MAIELAVNYERTAYREIFSNNKHDPFKNCQQYSCRNRIFLSLSALTKMP
ncbi:hypothetical protein PALA111701_24985 [Paenibacillus lactis]